MPLRSLYLETLATELAASSSLAAALSLGRPIMIPLAGNNLRDLYLLARCQGHRIRSAG